MVDLIRQVVQVPKNTGFWESPEQMHPSPVLAPVLGPLPLQGEQLALELLPHPHLDTAAVTLAHCITL